MVDGFTHGGKTEFLDVVQFVDESTKITTTVQTQIRIALGHWIVRPGKSIRHNLVDAPISPFSFGGGICSSYKRKKQRQRGPP